MVLFSLFLSKTLIHLTKLVYLGYCRGKLVSPCGEEDMGGWEERKIKKKVGRRGRKLRGHDPTRPNPPIQNPNPIFFPIPHHLIRLYSDLGTWLTHSIMPYYRKVPISLVNGTLEDSIKFWEVYNQVSNHLEQVF